MKKRIIVCVIMLMPLTALPQSLVENFSDESFSTAGWLKDDLTLVFSDKRNYLSGLRFVFEPLVGAPIQMGDNRIKSELIVASPKLGIETNIYKGWVAIQFVYFTPFQIQFDDQSPVVTQNLIATNDNKVDMDFGIGAGLSLIDGIISIGFGTLYLDQRDFLKSSPQFKERYTKRSFLSLSIQPVSAVRKILRK